MCLSSMKDSTKIELFYFYDNFRRIAQWVLSLIHIEPLQNHFRAAVCLKATEAKPTAFYVNARDQIQVVILLIWSLFY